MFVPTYYVCPHLLCPSPPIMSVPTHHFFADKPYLNLECGTSSPACPFLFFYSITLFYITFVAILTTAMSTLMPIYSLGGSWVYTCTVYTDWLYSCCVAVHFLYSTEVTNQKPRNLWHRQGTHTGSHAYGLYSKVALAKNFINFSQEEFWISAMSFEKLAFQGFISNSSLKSSKKFSRLI